MINKIARIEDIFASYTTNDADKFKARRLGMCRRHRAGQHTYCANCWAHNCCQHYCLGDVLVRSV